MRFATVCSGIEAPSVAWHKLNWKPVFFSQFDPEHDYKRGLDFSSKLTATMHFYYFLKSLFMEEKFESWALVELMGHNKIAGKVTEHKFGNQSMLRVDVPDVGELPAFTKIIAVNAVYAINPLSEQDAVDYAKILNAKPLDVWDMQSIFTNRIQDLVNKGTLLRPEIAEINDEESEAW